jgi:hypothetical protein
VWVHSEAERKKQEELMRERDILNKLKTQAENATQRQMDLVKINENTKKNLEQEIQGYKVEAQKQAKMIYQLEKEREKYGAEASDATAKYLQVGGGWISVSCCCMRKNCLHWLRNGVLHKSGPVAYDAGRQCVRCTVHCSYCPTQTVPT